MKRFLSRLKVISLSLLVLTSVNAQQPGKQPLPAVTATQTASEKVAASVPFEEKLLGPMPPDHRFRGDDDKGLLPTRPDSPSNYPEELVEGAKTWPSMPPLQHGELLSEHKVLQEKIPTATKGAKESTEPEQKQVEHGSEL